MTKSRQYKYHFRLTSNCKDTPLTPKTMLASDIARYILALEEVLVSDLKKNLGLENAPLYLTRISEGSVALEFTCDNTVNKAVQAMCNALNNNTFKENKKSSKIIQFTNEHNATLEIRKSKKAPILASIKGEPACDITQQSIEESIIELTTTLYGKIVGISGTEKIKCELSAIGYIGNFDFHITNEQAKELGAKYNEIVQVTGKAKILLPQRKIESFELVSISYDYKNIPVMEAMLQMREKFCGCFSKVVDPVDFVKNLRGTNVN